MEVRRKEHRLYAGIFQALQHGTKRHVIVQHEQQEHH
jgi:hypothetical protein